MKVLITLILVLLSACASPKYENVIPPPERVIHIDPRMLELCQPVLKLTTELNEEVFIHNLEIYADCANKQKNSVILLKEFSNYKDK